MRKLAIATVIAVLLIAPVTSTSARTKVPTWITAVSAETSRDRIVQVSGVVRSAVPRCVSDRFVTVSVTGVPNYGSDFTSSRGVFVVDGNGPEGGTYRITVHRVVRRAVVCRAAVFEVVFD